MWVSIVVLCNAYNILMTKPPLSPPLAGHIPAELGLLIALEELLLWDNELTGESIPFQNFSKLM